MAVYIVANDEDDQVYFSIDSSLVRINAAQLIQLAKDINRLDNGQGCTHYKIRSNDVKFVRYYLSEMKREGDYIPGELWVHPVLEDHKKHILAVLQGKADKIPMPQTDTKPT